MRRRATPETQAQSDRSAARRSPGQLSSTPPADFGPAAIAQRQFVESIGRSPRVVAQKARVDAAARRPRNSGRPISPRAGRAVIQRVETTMSLVGLDPPSDDRPVPVGITFAEEADGVAILQRLGLGDRRAFDDLDLAAPPDYAMQQHEWGLGYDRDTGRYVIVRGGPGAVSFGKGVLANVVGISHTHPVPTGAIAQGMEQESFLDMTEMAGQIGIDPVFGGYNSVFPSNADVIANYTVGRGEPEMLFTPYRLDNDLRFSDADDAQFVSVRFGPARATLKRDLPADAAENTAIDYLYAPMRVLRGGRPIWEGTLQVATDKASSAWPKTIAVPPDAGSRAENRVSIEQRQRAVPVARPLVIDEPVPRNIERADMRGRQPAREPVPEMVPVEPPPGKAATGRTKKKRCFITSACVSARGLPDNCHELAVLRRFRDGFMRGLPNGARLIAEYYRIAPGIVAGIQADVRRDDIFERVYHRIVDAVRSIERGDNERALRGYMAMVRDLAARYPQSPNRRLARASLRSA